MPDTILKHINTWLDKRKWYLEIFSFAKIILVEENDLLKARLRMQEVIYKAGLKELDSILEINAFEFTSYFGRKLECKYSFNFLGN